MSISRGLNGFSRDSNPLCTARSAQLSSARAHACMAYTHSILDALRQPTAAVAAAAATASATTASITAFDVAAAGVSRRAVGDRGAPGARHRLQQAYEVVRVPEGGQKRWSSVVVVVVVGVEWVVSGRWALIGVRCSVVGILCSVFGVWCSVVVE